MAQTSMIQSPITQLMQRLRHGFQEWVRREIIDFDPYEQDSYSPDQMTYQSEGADPQADTSPTPLQDTEVPVAPAVSHAATGEKS
uniref:Uncharacterized protein n=1 Tax=Cyanothece sp. (strain PCC 7425 / ATCC 29141) TaxID=395961 RepID=B8HU40_CYAP4